MPEVLDWVGRNPGAFASLTGATVGASVAALVFALTQYIGGRRQRTQFLLPKLEELYLLLNQVSANNAVLFKLLYQSAQGDQAARAELDTQDDLDVYGARLNKKIIMYVRLYFPKLSRIHQLLFRAQSELSDLVFRFYAGEPPDFDELLGRSGRVGHFLRLMEAELVNNRSRLLGDFLLYRRYVHTSKSAIETEIPPPDAPVLSSEARAETSGDLNQAEARSQVITESSSGIA